jgi:pimeloyl-ACP methyl ester carboxylesterase
MRDNNGKGVTFQGPQGELYIDDGGDGGLPVVFVHSAAGSTEHWAAQLRHLRPERRAVALDLRGHGRSAAPRDGDYRITSLAADLEAVLDHLGLKRVVLVGHSLGGVVCVAFAGAHAERVAGLFLLDPAGDGRKLPPEVVRGMMAGLQSDPYAATEAYWMTMLGPSSAVVRARLMKDLRATPAPAIVGPLEDLLVFDPITPLAGYQGPRSVVITAANESPAALHAQLPNLPVHKMATGHWVQLDDPEGVNTVLDGFLASLR